MNKKEKQLTKIYKDIKDIKIQGATSIAKAAVKAYLLRPDKENKKRLLGLRPTEPMLSNAINFLSREKVKKVIDHFDLAQNKINKEAYKIITNNSIIFTHCHSTNVIKSLIYAKKKGKKFEVYNTETRPLYQGRTTAKDLAKNKIKVTTFIDSGMHEAVKDCDLVLLGSDAILKNGVINKIGSDAIAEIAYVHKKPIYIVADSWKFSPRNVKIEERDFHEVWKNAPSEIKIRNPAFEKIDKKYIKGIISEYGKHSYNNFIKIIGNTL